MINCPYLSAHGNKPPTTNVRLSMEEKTLIFWHTILDPFDSFLWISLLKQVFVLAFEHQFTVLIMHRRLHRHHTGGPL